MALGRNLFIFENYALYQLAHHLFGLQPEHGYLIFKYTVVVQSAFAIVACWILARDFTRSLHAATLAALFIAVSPVFVLYGGQVMTDVPSVLLLAAALILHFRGLQQRRVLLVLAGAALLGLGMNLRETVGFYAPWLILAPFVCGWRLRRRDVAVIAASCLLFLLFGLGWFAFWFLTDPHYRWIWHGWRESMAQETARHPVTLQNLRPYLAYFFVSCPLLFLAMLPAMISEWRRHKLSPLLLLAATGLFADLLLFFNYSTAVNWRYFLTGMPAIAPVSAAFLIRVAHRRLRSVRLAFWFWTSAVVALAVVFGLLLRPASQQFIQRRAMSKEYRQQLVHVPRDAVMISGAQTIAVTYWKAIGLGDWKTIGTGGGWPGDDKLVPLIESYMSEGRRVFVDTDPRWWLPCGWQRDEIPAIVGLQKHFHFQRVTETIYELRPLSDSSAKDSPSLEKLLPENRPEDTKKCPPIQAENSRLKLAGKKESAGC